MVTALVGVWAAPNRAAALFRYGLFVLGLVLMIGIAYSARHRLETTLGLLGLGCALLAAVTAVHFLFTVNWAETGPYQLPFIQQIGLWINSYTPELAKLPNLHKNITGGMLIILLPLGLGGTSWAWSKNYRFIMAAGALALLAAFFGLFITVSRGAWLAFNLAIAYTAYFIWRFRPECRSRLRWLADILVLASTISLLVSLFFPLVRPGVEAIPNLALGKIVGGRTNLWQDSLAVIQDYPFTGSGLGNTTMVYSSYLFLLHVPFLATPTIYLFR